MPSSLTLAIQSTISTLLENSSSTDNAVDVLRRLRDESSRLYQQQLVRDEFDCDPLGAFRDDDDDENDGGGGGGGNSPREFVECLKSNLTIANHSYETTRDGHVDISCTIHFKTDDRTSKEVKDHVSLTFRYRRCPVISRRDGDGVARRRRRHRGDDDDDDDDDKDERNGDITTEETTAGDDGDATITTTAETVDGGRKRRKITTETNTTTAPPADDNRPSSPQTDETTMGTDVTYTIDAGNDWGPTERLLTVEVVARGDGPSASEPRPLPCDEEEEEEDVPVILATNGDDDDASFTKNNEMTDDASSSSSATPPHYPPASSSVSNDGDDDCDRYAAYVDPDVLSRFLNNVGAATVFDARSALLFLLTFPFYEREWDLVHFVLDSVLVGCDEEEAEEDGDGGVDEEYDSDGELVT